MTNDTQAKGPEHVDRLDSISKLEAEGFKGQDACLATSLFEYGLAWRALPESNEVLFIYGMGLNGRSCDYNRFDRATFASDLDVLEEFDWIDWTEFCNTQGCALDGWLALPLSDKISDLVNQHGFENIFGSSYWAGFGISED